MSLARVVTDLLAFELLDSVAATGSIGGCARLHGLSQPTVSVRMRALETALGVTLLHRDRRGAVLTPDGELVLRWARPILSDAAELEAALATLTDQPHRTVSIAASTTVAECLLPGWLDQLYTSHPETQVTLHGHNNTDTIELVRLAAAELGFTAGNIPPSMHRRALGTDELTVCVAPSHPWVEQGYVSPEQLADTPLILREAGSATRVTLEKRLAAREPPLHIHPVLELTSNTTIKEAAARGLAPAVVSSLTVVNELDAGTLVAIPVAGIALQRTIYAFWRPDYRFSPSARRLLDIAAGPQPGRHPPRR